MPRLPNLLDRNQLPEHLRPAYDRVAELRQGTVSGPYGVLLHSPELAEAGAALSNYCRWNSALTPVQRELAIITAAREFDALVMWGAHVRLGLELGISQETVDVIGHRRPLDGVSDEERDVIRYVRELLQANRVSQEAFDALRERVGDQGIVDLTGLVGYYSFVASILNAFEIEPGEGFTPLPEAPRG
jgi:4-carboxymuconolactone decarboxylase